MTVILLRHGRSTSNTAHVLAGRSEGVDLDDTGRQQATELVDRTKELPIRAVVCSPLLRCRRTIEPLAEALNIEPSLDDRLAEVDYGEWTGRKIGDLVKEPLWGVVQAHPSAAVRDHDARLAEQHGGDALWLACTHGDVIKAVVADALGLHLDGFQRVSADPASMSVIRYTPLRPFVLHVNHTGLRLSSALTAAAPADGAAPGDAVVGGSTE